MKQIKTETVTNQCRSCAIYYTCKKLSEDRCNEFKVHITVRNMTKYGEKTNYQNTELRGQYQNSEKVRFREDFWKYIDDREGDF